MVHYVRIPVVHGSVTRSAYRGRIRPTRTEFDPAPRWALSSPKKRWCVCLNLDLGLTTKSKSSVRTGATSCRERQPLPTLAGFEFIAEYVASRSRTNSPSSMLRETSAARITAASTSIGASAAPAQQPADRRERQNDGRNSEANPQEAHRRFHRSRDEDVLPTKTAGREDDRKARGFPNQGRPERDRPRRPQGRRRAAGAQLKCRADGVCS